MRSYVESSVTARQTSKGQGLRQAMDEVVKSCVVSRSGHIEFLNLRSWSLSLLRPVSLLGIVSLLYLLGGPPCVHKMGLPPPPKLAVLAVKRILSLRGFAMRFSPPPQRPYLLSTSLLWQRYHSKPAAAVFQRVGPQGLSSATAAMN